MNTTTTTAPKAAEKTRWYRQLYLQVLVAIVLGIIVGALGPALGVAMEPIGTTFVSLMKMLIGPIVFLTIVGGIASVADLKKVGLTGIKALTYFQVGTIIAMITGLVAINVFRLGDGVNADASKLKATGDVGIPVQAGEHVHWWDFLLRSCPTASSAPFVEGEILQIIFLAVIFGVALNAVGTCRSPGPRRRGAPDRGRVQDPLDHHEGRTARRVRRHGLRRRQLRISTRWPASVP